jgi:hypothetical protein
MPTGIVRWAVELMNVRPQLYSWNDSVNAKIAAVRVPSKRA